MTATTGLTQEPLDIPKPADNDETFWSVTTIIGALDKPALLYWAAEQTADAAIDNINTWQAMLQDEGRAATVKYLRDARFRAPKTKLASTALGTAVHKVCETYALTGEKPRRDYITELVHALGGDQVDLDIEPQVVNVMLNQFDDWLQQFQPSYQATEVTVFNETYKYAGTLDAFATIQDTRFIVDYKTSRDPVDSYGKPKTPYTEVALQLAAYRHAELAAVFRPRRYEQFRRRYYCLNQTERELAVTVPEVDHGLCIFITPEACEAHPIQCGPHIFTSFLYVQEAFRWLQEISATVVGEPLQ